MVKKIFQAFLIFTFAFAFSFSYASSLTQDQINAILNMLRAFGAEEQVVQQVRATLNGNSLGDSSSALQQDSGTSSNSSSSYDSNSSSAQVSFCPNLYRNLYKGLSGDDVSELQRFLKEVGVYSYPEITGYYGQVTEEAVKRFQSRAGVVSYGTPSATGYGLVGPATRAAIKKACGADKIAKSFLVTPTAGSVPFVAAVVFSYEGSDCTSFRLDWGDGSTPVVQYPQGSSCDNYIVKKTAKHTYVKEGEFEITLQISQKGKTETYRKTVHSGTPFARHFDINPTQGDAPLLVGVSFAIPDNECTAYKVEWGDGTESSKAKSSDNCGDSTVKMQSLTHTYQESGTYTLRLRLGQAPLENLPVVEQREIVVKSATQSASTGQSVISVHPTSGKAPLLVRVNLKGQEEACTSYEIDWGDSTAKQVYTASESSNCDGDFVKEFVHTYFIPGTYTLKVKAGKASLVSYPYEYHYINVNQ